MLIQKAIAPRDFHAPGTGLLINFRRGLAKQVARNQVALSVERNGLGILQADETGIGSRGDQELGFDLAADSAVGHVDPRVKAVVRDLGIGGYVRLPGVRSQKEIRLAGQRLASSDGNGRIGPQESHADLLPVDVKNCVVCTKLGREIRRLNHVPD